MLEIGMQSKTNRIYKITVKHFIQFSLAVCILLALTNCGGGGGNGEKGSSSSSAPTATDSCSILGLNLRVINGISCTGLEDSPIVRIISDFSSGRPGYCTGTLITPTKVLTAGHCGENVYDSSDIRRQTVVVTGLTGQDHLVTAARVTVHPRLQLQGPHILNDLAIVTLSHAVDLPTLPVLTSVVPTVGEEVSVFGYGRTQIGTPGYVSFPSFLKQTLDLRAGQMILTSVTDLQYRADAIAGKTTLCHGDSGGPLVIAHNGKPAVIGVASQVVANDERIHCAPGTNAEWTRLQAPSVLNELLALVPDVMTE